LPGKTKKDKQEEEEIATRLKLQGAGSGGNGNAGTGGMNPNVGTGNGGADASATGFTSTDPNALIGPTGVGAAKFIAPAATLSYTAEFENDGSVAAQDVVVTEQLDANLDWSTFQLGSFSFGPITLSVPADLKQYQTTVAYHNIDGTPLNVLVKLDFNAQTGLLTATFTSLDPATGQAPAGVTDGFLPPDNASGVGAGFVQYTVAPLPSLPTGAVVSGQASIVFDTNDPLATNTVSNTIDGGPPASQVNALPATETAAAFPLTWSGQDDANGAGIASFAVFVSDNGGPFALWQSFPATQTSATYTGQEGHHYGFYTVATDNVGHRETAPATAQASTSVTGPTSVPGSTLTVPLFKPVHGAGLQPDPLHKGKLVLVIGATVTGRDVIVLTGIKHGKAIQSIQVSITQKSGGHYKYFHKFPAKNIDRVVVIGTRAKHNI